MSLWKVSPYIIEQIFQHPRREELCLVVLGGRTLVVPNKTVNIGDIRVLVPKRSFVTQEIKNSIGLIGNKSHIDNTNKVISKNIAGELSEGILLPHNIIEEKFKQKNIQINLKDHIGKNIAQLLDITEWIPDLPAELVGNYNPCRLTDLNEHDVSGYNSVKKHFKNDELILYSEKVHGSQGSFSLFGPKISISSKRIHAHNLEIIENDKNIYWASFRSKNNFIEEFYRKNFKEEDLVQIFVEVVPVQNGYSYGFEKENPQWLGYRLDINQKTIHPHDIEKRWPELYQHFIPSYEIPFNMEKLIEISQGLETISGKNLHIKEGLVVRKSKKDDNAFKSPYFKIINPAYKGEDNDALPS